ncbi:MAG: hypothetical protein ACFFCQ_08140 [Promethearchaeota archaeon]
MTIALKETLKFLPEERNQVNTLAFIDMAKIFVSKGESKTAQALILALQSKYRSIKE